MGHGMLYNKIIKEKDVCSMKKDGKKEVFITDGYYLVMEAKRRREEEKKYIWDVEDDGYSFEETA